MEQLRPKDWNWDESLKMISLRNECMTVENLIQLYIPRKISPDLDALPSRGFFSFDLLFFLPSEESNRHRPETLQHICLVTNKREKPLERNA